MKTLLKKLSALLHVHKWEDNLYLEWDAVEQRCLTCNDHRHKTVSGWAKGRISKKDQINMKKMLTGIK